MNPNEMLSDHPRVLYCKEVGADLVTIPLDKYAELVGDDCVFDDDYVQWLECCLVDAKAGAELIRLNNVALREAYLGVAKVRDRLTAELKRLKK